MLNACRLFMLLFACETKVLPSEDTVGLPGDVASDVTSDADERLDSEVMTNDRSVRHDRGYSPPCPPSAVCPEAGSRCVADDRIVCVPDESGCLQPR